MVEMAGMVGDVGTVGMLEWSRWLGCSAAKRPPTLTTTKRLRPIHLRQPNFTSTDPPSRRLSLTGARQVELPVVQLQQRIVEVPAVEIHEQPSEVRERSTAYDTFDSIQVVKVEVREVVRQVPKVEARRRQRKPQSQTGPSRRGAIC